MNINKKFCLCSLMGILFCSLLSGTREGALAEEMKEELVPIDLEIIEEAVLSEDPTQINLENEVPQTEEIIIDVISISEDQPSDPLNTENIEVISIERAEEESIQNEESAVNEEVITEESNISEDVDPLPSAEEQPKEIDTLSEENTILSIEEEKLTLEEIGEATDTPKDEDDVIVPEIEEVENISQEEKTQIYLKPIHFPQGGIDRYTTLLIRGEEGIRDISKSNYIIDSKGTIGLSAEITILGEQSISFDGIDDYLYLQPNENLYFKDNEFTIDFWIHPLASNQLQSLIGQYGMTDASWRIILDEENKLRFETQGIDCSLTSSLALSPNQWSHVAFVRGEGQFSLFINGESSDTSFCDGTLVESNSILEIGISSFSGYFEGYLSEVRISNGVARWKKDFTPFQYPYDSFNPPEAKTVSISGTPNIGETLVGSYTFFDENNDAEGETLYRWLHAEIIDGGYIAVPESTEKTIQLTSNYRGNFIKFEVTPLSQNRPFKGMSRRSEAIGPINTVPTVSEITTTHTYANNTNKDNFMLGCRFTELDTEQVLIEYSLNNSNQWHSLGEGIGPHQDFLYQAAIDLTMPIVNKELRQGVNLLRCRVSDSTTQSNISDRIEFILDTIPPEITSSYQHHREWVNTPQTLSIEVKEEESGLEAVKYCFGEGCNPEKGEILESLFLEENINDVVKYQAFDQAGNKSDIKEDRIQIDIIAPERGTFTYKRVENHIEINFFQGEDLFSGIEGSSIQIKKGTLNNGDCKSYSGWEDVILLSSGDHEIYNLISENGSFQTGCYKFQYRVWDKAGNEILKAGEEIKIGSIPSVESISMNGERVLGSTLKGSYTYRDKEGDTESVSKYQWMRSVQKGGEYVQINGATEKQYTIQKEDEGYYLRWAVIPMSSQPPSQGQEVFSEAFKINIAPEISAISSQEAYINFENEKHFSIACGGITDPDADELMVSYSFNQGQDWYPLGGKVQGPVNNYTHTGNINLITTRPRGSESNGKKEILCKVSDGFREKITSNSLKIGKDTEGPEINHNYSYDGLWTNEVQNISVQASDKGSGVDFIMYCKGKGCTPSSGQKGASVDISTSTDEVLIFQAWDKFGNISLLLPIEVKVDLLPPEKMVITDEGLFSRDNTLSFHWKIPNDNLSGGSFVQLCIDDNKKMPCEQIVELPISKKEYEWSPVPWRVSYFAQIQALDQAGNTSQWSDWTDGVMASSEKPEAKDVQIEGSFMVGETLIGTYKYFDAEDDKEQKTRYQWYRSTDNIHFSVIEGATEQKYRISIEDIDAFIRFEVLPVTNIEPKEGLSVQSKSSTKVTQPYKIESWTGHQIPEGDILVYTKSWQGEELHIPEKIEIELLASGRSTLLARKIYNQDQVGPVAKGDFSTRMDDLFGTALLKTNFTEGILGSMYLKTNLYDESNFLLASEHSQKFTLVPKNPPEIILDPVPNITKADVIILSGIIKDPNISEQDHFFINDQPIEITQKNKEEWYFKNQFNLSEGLNMFMLRASDIFGNERQQEIEVVLDTTSPTAPVLKQPLDTSRYYRSNNDIGYSTSRNIYLRWEGSTDSATEIKHYEIWRAKSNGDEPLSYEKISENILSRVQTWRDNDLVDGIYYYKIKAFDEALNESASEEKSITVDTQAPEIKVKHPESDLLINETYLEFRLIFYEEGTSCQIKEGENAWENMIEGEVLKDNFVYHFSSLEEGIHNFLIECRDLSGNKAQQHIENIMIDSRAPRAYLEIDQEAKESYSSDVVLYMTFHEDLKGLLCRYKNDFSKEESEIEQETFEGLKSPNDIWTEWDSCTNKKSWNLSPGFGEKKVLYEIVDQAGNIGTGGDEIFIKQKPALIKNIGIKGLPVIGQEIEGIYKQELLKDKTKYSFKYEWTSSIKMDGTFKTIEGQNDRTFSLTPNEYGRYIQFKILIFEEGETKPIEVSSTPFGPILPEEAIHDLRTISEERITSASNNTTGTKVVLLNESQKLKINKNRDMHFIEDKIIASVLDHFSGKESTIEDTKIATSILQESDMILTSDKQTEVKLQKGTVFFGNHEWDGVIEGPKDITHDIAPSEEYTIEGAISAGADKTTILLDTPAKIIIPTSDGLPHYSIDGEAWVEISTPCEDEMGTNLAFPGECYFKSGDQTIIWTYHFTKFGNFSDKKAPELKDVQVEEYNKYLDLTFSEGVYGDGEEGPVSLLYFDIVTGNQEEIHHLPVEVSTPEKKSLEGGEKQIRLMLPEELIKKAENLTLSISDTKNISDKAGNPITEKILAPNINLHRYPQITQINILGNLMVGETLTGEYVIEEGFKKEEIADILSFNWYESESEDGDFAKTKETKAPTYTLKASEKDKYIKLKIYVGRTMAYESSVVGPVLSIPPTAEKVFLSGVPLTGHTLQGQYTYIDKDRDLEGDSLYRWFFSETKDGIFEEKKEEHFIDYKIASEDLGKYIQLEITPISLTGTPAQGTPIKSPIYGPLGDGETATDISKVNKKDIKLDKIDLGKVSLPSNVNTFVLSKDQVLSFQEEIEEILDTEASIILQEKSTQLAFEALGRRNKNKKAKKLTLISGKKDTPIKLISTDNIELEIPDGATLYGEETWDGIFLSPKKETSPQNIPGRLVINSIVLGALDEVIILDKPAKITFPYSGETESKILYSIDQTQWTEITTPCLSAEGEGIAFPQECFWRDDKGITVWTYHFTHYSEAGDQVTEDITFSLDISDGVLSVDIVDNGGDMVVSPSVNMSAITTNFVNQNSTGTLGTSSEQIILYNPTSTEAWSVTLAASGGASAVWEETGNSTMDFNATDGTGQLTIDPSSGTVSLVNINTSTGAITSLSQDAGDIAGMSLGSSASFVQGTIDSITLFTSSTAVAYKAYSLQGVSLTQLVPAKQPAADYQLDLMLTSS